MLKPSVTALDNVFGPRDAHITLVEFGDYECPHCGHAYGIIKNIQKKMEGELLFVFRNFPLQESHPHAFLAAVATEAAGRQNAFWPMHDVVFENQRSIGRADLLGFAHQLKLDVKTFESDLHDPALKEKVERDFESGIRSGVNGTPTFFINEARYDGSWAETDLLQALRNTMQKVQ